MRELVNGEQLEVGDCIVIRSWFGDCKRKVHRVTKKFAFARITEESEAKYPRTYDLNFQSLPRQSYPTTEYLAFRK